MECVLFVRGHWHELSGVPNYPGAELINLYCNGFMTVIEKVSNWCLQDTCVIYKVCFQKSTICAEWITMNYN